MRELAIRISDDLVHLQVQIRVLVRQVLGQVSLVDSARRLVQDRLEQNFSTDISCIVWYAQKFKALPAHSIITLGLSPLNTLVL
jgi:hypothetical protein